ncbi:Vsp/OspC family lipoprotein, partial [Borreliella garinii]
LDNLTDHNGSLIAGAYVISTLITEKLNNLKNSEGLKEKIKKVKECSDKFTKKLTTSNGDLGKENVTDAHAQAAILKTNPTNDKGAKELGELFESVEILSKAAQEALTNSIAELTSPVVAENPKNP